VPPVAIQELRDLTRTRKQLTREVAQHSQRIQAVLEEANVKVCSIITDILGTSGRRMLKAMIAGETDAHKLASRAWPRTRPDWPIASATWATTLKSGLPHEAPDRVSS
jgi:transposase